MDSNQPNQIISPDSGQKTEATEPTDELQTPETESPEPTPMAPLPGTKPEKSKKKILIILAVVLGLAVAGGLVWYFFLKDSEQAADTSQSQVSQVVEEKTSSLPDNVAYAYRTTDPEPYKIYYRPTAGGERVEVGPLAEKSYVSEYDVNGQNVVYYADSVSEDSTGKAVWVSKDSGKTYSKLLDIKGQDAVTSLIFSTDGKAVAVAVTGEGNSNTVKLVDADSKQVTAETTVDSLGVYLKGYNRGDNEILYFKGCFNCDGVPYPELYRMNMTDKKATVFTSVETSKLMEVKVKPDYSEVLIGTSTEQDPDESGGLPAYGAPFEIYTVSLADASKKPVTTITGEQDTYIQQLGYTNNEQLPFYVYNNSVNIVKDGNPSKVYETENTVEGIYYLDNTKAIAYIGRGAEYSLEDINLETKASSVIMNGDGNLRIFGVTTK